MAVSGPGDICHLQLSLGISKCFSVIDWLEVSSFHKWADLSSEQKETCAFAHEYLAGSAGQI